MSTFGSPVPASAPGPGTGSGGPGGAGGPAPYGLPPGPGAPPNTGAPAGVGPGAPPGPGGPAAPPGPGSPPGPGPGAPPGPGGPGEQNHDQPAAQTESVKGMVTSAQPVRADLLPRRYRDKIALASARRRTVLALVVAMAVVLVGFLLASLQVGVATSTRNSAQAEQAAAQQAVNALADVPRITNLVTEVSAGLAIALSNEVLFSQLSSDTASALPQGTVLETMSWTLVDPSVALEGVAEGPVDLGDLALNGTVCQFTGGAPLLDSLSALPELNNVWLSSQSFTDIGADGSPCVNQPQYAFAVSGDIGEDALSNRFAAEELAATRGNQQ